MNKPIIISDKNKKSLKIKKILIKKIKKDKIKISKLIIVIGGDGFMLQTLKKNRNTSNLFYGINSGNYGFLMNKFFQKNFVKNLSKAKMIKISYHLFSGALGQTRTGTPKRARILSPLCLPISPRGHL